MAQIVTDKAGPWKFTIVLISGIKIPNTLNLQIFTVIASPEKFTTTFLRTRKNTIVKSKKSDTRRQKIYYREIYYHHFRDFWRKQPLSRRKKHDSKKCYIADCSRKCLIFIQDEMKSFSLFASKGRDSKKNPFAECSRERVTLIRVDRKRFAEIFEIFAIY